MDTSLFKLALSSQTTCGAVQFFVVFFALGGVLVALGIYHAENRFTFNCSPKPDDFTKQLCYDKYTFTMSPLLIPRNVAAIIYGILCFCWICFLLYGSVTLRQIKREQAEQNRRRHQWRKFRRVYNIHVFCRLAFVSAMIGLFCSYQTLDLPSVFKCSTHTPQTNTTAISGNKTGSTMKCNDLRYKEKSILNIVILVIDAFIVMLGIVELLQLTLSRRPFQEKLLGNVFEVTNNLDVENLLATENNSSGES